MLRFYAIILLYVIFIISTLLFIGESSELLFVLSLSTFAFVLTLVWGVSSVRSQMFVDSFNSNPRAIGKVAITYDDGPHENTLKLLEIFKKYDAKASFFLIGENIVKHQEIAKSIHQEGHTIGNHSYYHKNTFPLQSVKSIRAEIDQTQSEIYNITQKHNQLFRPPYGVINPSIAKAINRSGLQTIGWNIRSFDTKAKDSKEEILKRVLGKIKTGDIVLLHDKTEHVLWLTEEILFYLKENNLEAVGVEELMKA